jgi:hypothetical protein
LALKASRAFHQHPRHSLACYRTAVTWIIVLLLLAGAFAAVGLRMDARTRDKPAELSLAQRWKAMGGG